MLGMKERERERERESETETMRFAFLFLVDALQSIVIKKGRVAQGLEWRRPSA